MELSLAPGSVVADKYRVEREVGRGGMGVVLACWHQELQCRVALKFLTNEAAPRAASVRRLLREARLLAHIRTDHVARVLDVCTLEQGAPYIVMEYLEGSTLRHVLNQAEVPVQRAVGYVLQAAVALVEAHALGVVHRDIKPDNLFLTRRNDGTELVKVIDFGISKPLEGCDLHSLDLTDSRAIMGSPKYMSPEQLEDSSSIDHRCDVWALGVTLHELLCGVVPFRADSLPGLVSRIMTDAPQMGLSRVRGVDARLAAVVRDCLRKDPSQRVPSVAALAQRLAPFAASEDVELVQRIVRLDLARGRTQEAATPSLPSVNRTYQASMARRRWPLAAAGALTVVGGYLVLSQLAQRQAGPLPAAAVQALQGADVQATIKPPSFPPLPGAQESPPRRVVVGVEAQTMAPSPVERERARFSRSSKPALVTRRLPTLKRSPPTPSPPIEVPTRRMSRPTSSRAATRNGASDLDYFNDTH